MVTILAVSNEACDAKRKCSGPLNTENRKYICQIGTFISSYHSNWERAFSLR